MFSTRPALSRSRAYARGGFWGKTPLLELDILQKFYYLHKEINLFSHTFCLLICRLTTE